MQNGFETDVDCGGPSCTTCATGRHCLYDSDCDQTGSTTLGTIYPIGTTMIVCSSRTLLCVDLRAGSQAYRGNVTTPGFVSFNLSVSLLSVADFTAPVIASVDTAIAKSLGYFSLPLIVPEDVLVIEVRFLH